MQNSRKTKQTHIETLALRKRLRLIGGLNRAGMASGNNGDFDAAVGNLNDALTLAEQLDKQCLVGKLLNNLGIIYTQSGSWDRAMLSYGRAMNLVSTHHGTNNVLYKTIQKNISYLCGVKL